MEAAHNKQDTRVRERIRQARLQQHQARKLLIIEIVFIEILGGNVNQNNSLEKRLKVE